MRDETVNPAPILAALWAEMFHADTPDSYQPRLSNAPSLAKEIFSVSKRALISERWQKQLKPLQEELKEVLKNESHLLSFNGYYLFLLSRLCELNRDAIVPLEKVTVKYEDRYYANIKECLSAIVDELPSAKSKAVKLVRNWATYSIQKGIDVSRIRTHEDNGSFLSDQDFIPNLINDKIFDEDKYWCCVAIEGSCGDAQSIGRKVGVDLIPKNKTENPAVAEFIDESETENSNKLSFFSTETSAVSSNEASKFAVNKIRSAIDVFNFYSESSELRILPYVLTRSEGGSYSKTLQQVHQFKQRFPRKARELTNKTLSEINRDKLDGRLINALEHYKLALGSSATRVKLVNLWTATECLTENKSSVIDSVSEVVAPIVVWRRSDKILSYVSNRLNHALKEKGADVPDELKHNVNGKLSREELLLTIAKKDTPDWFTTMLSDVSFDALLLQRLKELQETFSDPRELLKILQRSKKRTEWHLSRIYRVRNLIIHEGDGSDLSEWLLDNLHYYFSITLSRVLHGMQILDNSTVDESTGYWKSKSDYLLKQLKEGPELLMVSDFFACAYSYSNYKVWPNVE